jgi:hypothetical protein
MSKVPDVDGTLNVHERDVIGNKTDAQVTAVAATKSIIAYVKGLVALSLVATADAVANICTSDVVGNKADVAVNAVVADKSLMGYLKALIAGSALGVGTTFWIKKTFLSSAVVQAGADVTGVSATGEIEIEDVILKTGGVGLAAGTNVQVYTDNAKGLANILAETVANLGANKTVSLFDASVAKVKTVLEVGKKVKINSTVADCTGAGTVDVYLKCRRLTAGATLAAA